MQYKTAFVLAHKLREAMASEMKEHKLGGTGKVVEVDGGYFGGYVKPANHKENRRDLRRLRNQTGKRQCVIVVRERDEHTLPAAFKSEVEPMSFIRNRAPKAPKLGRTTPRRGTSCTHATWSSASTTSSPNSMDGACTNGAESFFSRMRRAEQGHHHHIAGTYFARYAQESAWREDHRREANGAQVRQVTFLALRSRPSVDFCGYWQRAMNEMVHNPRTSLELLLNGYQMTEMDRSKVETFLEEIEGVAYRRGRADALQEVIARLQEMAVDLAPQTDLPFEQSFTAVPYQPVRLRARSDQYRVYQVILRQPGIRGVDIIETLDAADMPVHERTMRTALHRLRGYGLIKLEGTGWHPTSKTINVIGDVALDAKGAEQTGQPG